MATAQSLLITILLWESSNSSTPMWWWCERSQMAGRQMVNLRNVVWWWCERSQMAGRQMVNLRNVVWWWCERSQMVGRQMLNLRNVVFWGDEWGPFCQWINFWMLRYYNFLVLFLGGSPNRTTKRPCWWKGKSASGYELKMILLDRQADRGFARSRLGFARSRLCTNEDGTTNNLVLYTVRNDT